MRFGSAIRNLRCIKELTLRDASKATGIDAVRYSQLERHVAETGPTPDEIAKLKALLGDFLVDEYKPDYDVIRTEKEQLELLRNAKFKEELLAHGILACKTHGEE